MIKISEEEAGEILNKPKLTTHELAKALLALPDTEIGYESHTEIWSVEDLVEGVQVGLHRY